MRKEEEDYVVFQSALLTLHIHASLYNGLRHGSRLVMQREGCVCSNGARARLLGRQAWDSRYLDAYATADKAHARLVKRHRRAAAATTTTTTTTTATTTIHTTEADDEEGDGDGDATGTATATATTETTAMATATTEAAVAAAAMERGDEEHRVVSERAKALHWDAMTWAEVNSVANALEIDVHPDWTSREGLDGALSSAIKPASQGGYRPPCPRGRARCIAPEAVLRIGEALGVRMIPHVLREELPPAQARRMMRAAMGARAGGSGGGGGGGVEAVGGEEELEGKQIID